MLKQLLFFVLLAVGTLAMAPQALAAPGDTTRVTIFNKRPLTYYGNYDTTATFPAAGRYRKILLHYVLGRYACPAGSLFRSRPATAAARCGQAAFCRPPALGQPIPTSLLPFFL